LGYVTFTLMTGGEKLGSNETAKRGSAKRPRTTMAVAIMATATRRVTANWAMGWIRGKLGLPTAGGVEEVFSEVSLPALEELEP
jgi:hypothetical protein